ncbi:MAG: serine/threonine-protein phosphatase [Spirochaetaceae bacterium]|nr:serine/threonine-protein phosphatase [Spirochaetaceae bacterium]
MELSSLIGDKNQVAEETGVKKKNLHFSPTQVGCITNRIEPISIASDVRGAINFDSGTDNADVMPVERHGVILGFLRRESINELKNTKPTLMNRGLNSKNMLTSLLPVQEVIEASTYISTVVERGLRTTHWDDPAWYVVEHKHKYLGVVNLRQMMEYLDGVRFRDILRAGEIQGNLLNQPPVHDPRFTLLTYNKMANEVGGDWYKTLRLNKDMYLVGCFDVAGKNISGSLVTMSLGSCFAALELVRYSETEPQKITTLLNSLVRTVNPPDVFVAAAILYVNFSTMSIVIHNCGLSPVVAFIPTGEKSIGYKIYQPNMPPLGLAEEIIPEPFQKLPISNGLRIVVYSDGLGDIKDIYGEQYGEERTLDFLQNLHFLSGEGYSTFIDREINLWTKDTALADDVTLFEIRFGHEWPSSEQSLLR